jgi:GT2 family glycosyltransferase
MPRVTLIQQVFNSRRYIPQVYDAMVAQTYEDIQIISQIVIDDGGCEEYIRTHYPQIKVLNPGYNIGFAPGHNQIFASEDSDFFQLVNPDLILQPTFVEEMLKVMDGYPKIGSASGKVLRYDFANNQPTNIIDTTGVVVSRSGGARDRGQHEEDLGQYDQALDIIGPSGAAAMYRQAALEEVKYKRPDGRYEYFDEDFHSYWEDVDLTWRMINAGWRGRYVPHALAYHGRAAGSSKGGYKKVFAFIQHHKQISSWVRRLNYKNHIYMYIKNSPRWYWQFFVREFFYQIYVLLIEPSTLGVLPEFFRGLKNMFVKRGYIKERRKVSIPEIERLLQ